MFCQAAGVAAPDVSGRVVYCGKPEDSATQQRYHQAVAEWMAAGKQLPAEPLVSRQVWAMIPLRLYTGARAGEITQMRLCDIDRSGQVWVYRPMNHKTAHHGFERKIFIGPQAQEGVVVIPAP